MRGGRHYAVDATSGYAAHTVEGGAWASFQAPLLNAHAASPIYYYSAAYNLSHRHKPRSPALCYTFVVC